MPNFYEVLGVQKTASKDDIKKAYRKAALRTHPDRVPQEQKKQAEDAFRAINAAYEILSNDANRAVYDKHGAWPPPASSSSKSKPFKTKPREAPEYKPFQNPYESDAGGATYQHFVFTDPFALFNMIFADLYQQQQAAAAYHMRRPQAVPIYPDPYAAQPHYAQYTAYAQSSTQFPTQQQPAPPPPPPPQVHHHRSSQPASRTESPVGSDGGDSGWIKESKVTKITPQGTRETTIKKTAPDGTVYITRIGGDGVARHFILVNGEEKPSATAPPVTPPRVPLSQTQAQGQPPFPRADFGPSPQSSQSRRSSSRHAPSASQPVNAMHTSSRDRTSSTVPPPPPQVQPVHPPTSGVTSSGGHRRSSSRAGTSSAYPMNYRAASPTPMAPHEAAPGISRAYVNTTGTGTTARRATSPGLKSASYSGSGSDSAPRSKTTAEPLKRNHTLPGHIVQEQVQTGGTLPRPQSPHFYRTRTTSEQRKATDPLPRTASYRPKETREDPMHIMSDNEASRGRPAMYRPSRSSNTYPIPDPNMYRPMSTQPMHISQNPPPPPPKTAPVVPQPTQQPVYQQVHASRQQQIPTGQAQQPIQKAQPVPQAHQAPQPIPPQPRPAAHRSSHHTQKAQPPSPLDNIPITNELGLGFVPPPSAGFASNRSSYASNGPNPPLGKSSRTNSYEEIVYPHRTSSKPTQYATQSSQPQYVYAGNPMPNPPMMNNPQVMRDPYPQPVRYRSTAA